MSQMFHWYNSELKQQSKDKQEKELTVQGIPVKFYRNNYINSFSEFWKVEALFKKDEVKFVLNSFGGEISDASIERLFEKPSIQFYTDKNEKTLFSYTSSKRTGVSTFASRTSPTHRPKLAKELPPFPP
jgi:hypothetical protein